MAQRVEQGGTGACEVSGRRREEFGGAPLPKLPDLLCGRYSGSDEMGAIQDALFNESGSDILLPERRVFSECQVEANVVWERKESEWGVVFHRQLS